MELENIVANTVLLKAREGKGGSKSCSLGGLCRGGLFQCSFGARGIERMKKQQQINYFCIQELKYTFFSWLVERSWGISWWDVNVSLREFLVNREAGISQQWLVLLNTDIHGVCVCLYTRDHQYALFSPFWSSFRLGWGVAPVRDLSSSLNRKCCTWTSRSGRQCKNLSCGTCNNSRLPCKGRPWHLSDIRSYRRRNIPRCYMWLGGCIYNLSPKNIDARSIGRAA